MNERRKNFCSRKKIVSFVMFIALGFGGLLVGLVYNFQLVPAIIPW